MVGSHHENVKIAIKRGLIRANIEVARRSTLRSLVGLLATHRVGTTLDVGANEGQFARLLRTAGFAGRIVSYEPMRREAEIIEERSRADGNWEVVASALGASAGSSSINVAENSYSSSLLDVARRHVDAAPASAATRREEIEVRTLAGELDRLGLDPAHAFLKVDTQGYERHVLDGAGGRLAEFPVLQLELSMVPLYEGAPVFDDLYPWLRDRGFRLWTLEPGFTSPAGEMLQCDGVFVRSDLDSSGSD